MNVLRATIGNGPDGSVIIDDPEAPYVVRLWLTAEDGHTYISSIRVDVRSEPISAARLGRLPIEAMLDVVSDRRRMTGHANEALYGLLTRGPRPGAAGRPEDHWGLVLEIYEWARETNRPGGPARAVADMWGVQVDPTVYRWLAETRRRFGGRPTR